MIKVTFQQHTKRLDRWLMVKVDDEGNRSLFLIRGQEELDIMKDDVTYRLNVTPQLINA